MAWTIVFIILASKEILQVHCKLFHVLSAIHMKPKSDLPSDFGFSLAYQKNTGRLAVGAPSEGQHGRMYTCDLKTTECDEVNIDWDRVAPTDLTNKFCMGASISASSEYFFACAPLWARVVVKQGYNKSNAFGTCFVVKPGESVTRYKGGIEKHMENIGLGMPPLDFIIGGTGWTTLIDEPNDVILIAKVSPAYDDFIYLQNSQPLRPTKQSYDKGWMKTLTKQMNKEDSPRNIGYAMTAGKFFSTNQMVYAFSMTEMDMTGKIGFLTLRRKSLFWLRNVFVVTDDVATTFGAALATADTNRDGLSDLLVGAPTYSDDDAMDCGALHIYIGGSKSTINDPSRKRTIVGAERGARFGSAIIAHDLDRDGLPEIIASAPFEENTGLVYIFSGHDVYHTLINHNVFKMVTISDLKSTQVLQTGSKRLGYSLQIVADVDQNGCDDLAVGAPKTSEVQIFKCVQSIIVNITAATVGEVSFKHDNFTVEVCANVQYPNMKIVDAPALTIINRVKGTGATVLEPEFPLNLSCSPCKAVIPVCKAVTINLTDVETSDYSFTTTATMDVAPIFSSTEFKGTEVTLSHLSNLEKTITVVRTCTGECKPELTMDFLWSGSDPYTIGSSDLESLTMKISNEGNNSYNACVRLRVHGALPKLECAQSGEDYWCYLPKPLKRGGQHSILITMDMTMPVNTYQGLEVNAVLYDECKQPDSLYQPNIKNIKYVFSADLVYVDGVSHSRQEVTDEQIQNSNHSIDSVHKYLITNKGNILWSNVTAVISIKKQPFIEAYESTSRYVRQDTGDRVELHCTLRLLRDAKQKIIVTQKFNKHAIENNLDDSKLYTTSKLTLLLPPSMDIKSSSVTSTMTYKKDMKFYNNMKLIIILSASGGVLLLSIAATIMYKKGFFVRKQKKKLAIVRESVRRLSSRKRTPSRKKSKPAPMLGSAPNLQCYTPRSYPLTKPIRRNSM